MEIVTFRPFHDFLSDPCDGTSLHGGRTFEKNGKLKDEMKFADTESARELFLEMK
jgi:hypothetical protein